MIVGPFLASSLLTVLGGVMVMSQLGIGDPNQGVEYTLGSVAAVLLTLCAVAVYSQAAIIQSKSLAEIDGQELRVREPPPPFSYGVRRKRPPAG